MKSINLCAPSATTLANSAPITMIPRVAPSVLQSIIAIQMGPDNVSAMMVILTMSLKRAKNATIPAGPAQGAVLTPA